MSVFSLYHWYVKLELLAPAVGEFVKLAVNVVALPAQITILLGVKVPFNNGWLGKGCSFTVANTTLLVQPSAFNTVTEYVPAFNPLNIVLVW